MLLQEITPPDTALACAALQELRPAFTDAAELARQIDDVQRPEGYRIIGVLPDPGRPAVSVAGFRLTTSLSWGRHLYIDDLSTLPSARGEGHAGRLLAWVHEEARRLGCLEVHLDSGVGPTRADAHRLYLNTGYLIVAHHFARDA